MNRGALILAGVMSAVALTFPHPSLAQTPTDRPAATQAASGFELRPGDLVQISVWPDPNRELAGEFTIQEAVR